MNFSIITCTYNPNLEILERLVNAVNKLEKTGNVDFEWIIVDNNSNCPVCEISFVRDAVIAYSKYKVITEITPGLTSARRAGIKKSIYDWVIFFDDDNEPKQDYLTNAQRIITEFPDVGCWGPGNISVEFCKAKPDKWALGKKEYFQERHVTENEIGNEPIWKENYPVGTGLICNKRILNEYMDLLTDKRIEISDRKGKSLSSGGDTQIVLLAIKLGYFVGISPKINVNHLISSSKATFKYLVRLEYSTNSCYLAAHNGVFVENLIKVTVPKNRDVVLQYYHHVKMYLTANISLKDSIFKLSAKLGQINACYILLKTKKKPFLLKIFEWIYKAHV